MRGRAAAKAGEGEKGSADPETVTRTAAGTPRVTRMSDWCGQSRRKIILMDNHPETCTEAWRCQQTHSLTNTRRGTLRRTRPMYGSHTHTHTHRLRRTARATPGTDTHRQNGLIKPESQDDADNWPVIFQ